MKEVKRKLSTQFEIKDLGDLHYFQLFEIPQKNQCGLDNQPTHPQL